MTLLKRKLRRSLWSAICLLMVGMGIAQTAASASARTAVIGANVALGVTAVLASSALSGFANVFFERLVKNEGPNQGEKTGLYAKQLQLGLW